MLAKHGGGVGVLFAERDGGHSDRFKPKAEPPDAREKIEHAGHAAALLACMACA
jgi:hypothetical protein